MGPHPAILATQGPGWWYDAWGPADWLATLFNQPVEVHTFELGALLGVVLASLVVRRRQRLALLVVLLVGLFTFGTLETVSVCSSGYSACQHVRLKPWYFLGGFLAAHLLSLGMFGAVARYVPTAEESLASVERPLLELVVVVLLGLAVYSFVSPTPVNPITGLATVGGFAGGALGLAAYEWAVEDAGPTGFGAVLRRVVRRDVDTVDLVVGYGTVIGFGFPRLYWELGVWAGKEDFLFGTITWATGAMLSVASYVFVVFLVGLILYRRQLDGSEAIGGHRFAALVLGYVTYAACLFVATGYAERFWFHLIPSASG